MDKSFIDTWQESSKSFAGLFKNISDKNIALTQQLYANLASTQQLYANLASKQYTNMTEAAFQMGCGMKNAGEKGLLDGSISFLPMQILSQSYIQPVKELNEIYLAGFEKISESQISMWKSYIDLLSNFVENLNKSRGVDDVVAINFDYMSNLMMTAKSGALDSLTAGEAIKTALVAWSDNSLQVIEEDEASVAH